MTMMNVTLEPVEDSIHFNVFVNGMDLGRFITGINYVACAGEVPKVEITFIGHLEMVNMPSDVQAIIDELQAETILAEMGLEVEKATE